MIMMSEIDKKIGKQIAKAQNHINKAIETFESDKSGDPIVDSNLMGKLEAAYVVLGSVCEELVGE